MSAEENKATLLRLLDELRKGNLDTIDDVFSPNFAFYTPFFPNWPRGLDDARKMITQLRTAISDIQATVEDIFGEGDKVFVR